MPVSDWYPREKTDRIFCANGEYDYQVFRYDNRLEYGARHLWWESTTQSPVYSKFCGTIIRVMSDWFQCDIPDRETRFFKTLSDAERHLTTVNCEVC